MRRARVFALAALAALCSLGAVAQEFVVKDIRVEGVQRTDPGTVFSYLPLRVGDRYDPDKGINAIRALYATGLFKDVRLEVDGTVLVVIVEERPAIAAVELNGIKEFDKDTVRKSLREVGLAEGRIFDRSLLDRAEQELKKQYLGRGKYAAHVTTVVTPIERNRVNVVINVDEGESAKILTIDFTGNKAFSDGDLRDQLELTTPGWFTWYTKRDQYARQKLQGDLETLRSFYLNRGYLDFAVESTQVSISPDKEDIHITINISEGERYTISEVKLSGELLGLDGELNALVDVRPGDTFNAERMNLLSKRIGERLSALGYAFANANPVPEPNREKRQVAFTIVVDPGRRVYVRRVNISGNTRTKDEIVRREVRQFESAWYDAEKVRLSRDRIDRLGFFEKVEVDTPAVPGTTDQIDINFTIKERPTGTIQAGAGYSQVDKLVLQGSYSQQNVFGTGNALSFEINTSRSTRVLSITHVDPYVTQDGISRSIEVSDRTTNFQPLGQGNLRSTARVAGVGFGVPFTEFDTVFFGARFELTRLAIVRCATIAPNTPPQVLPPPSDPQYPPLPIPVTVVPYCLSSPQRYITFVDEFGDEPKALIGTIGWSRDSRDNLLVPTRGRYQRISGEVGTPAYDLQYVAARYQYQQFEPLTPKFTLAFNGELAWGKGYGGKPYPLFKNFFAGGLGSGGVRGYESGSLGPREIVNGTTGSALGGTKRINGSIEALAPLPGADRTLRALTFLDGGQVWGENDSVRLKEMRYSTGIGIAWVSPIGPLKLSWALPIHSQPGDQIQRFQFQIGTGF